MGKSKLKLGNSAASLLILFILRLISVTYRYRFKGKDQMIARLEKGDKLLFCHWHQLFFPVIMPYAKWFTRFSPAAMISRSRDGDMMSRVIERMGWQAIRGSSTRGGRDAMEEMISHAKTHGLVAHVLDGPTGPMGIAKPGAIRIAQKSGALLVPIKMTAENRWHLRSWDRFIIPKPFSKVFISFEEPLLPPAMDADSEAFEEVRKALEDRMRPWLY